LQNAAAKGAKATADSPVGDAAKKTGTVTADGAKAAGSATASGAKTVGTGIKGAVTPDKKDSEKK
jgi:hypothetical protein